MSDTSYGTPPALRPDPSGQTGGFSDSGPEGSYNPYAGATQTLSGGSFGQNFDPGVIQSRYNVANQNYLDDIQSQADTQAAIYKNAQQYELGQAAPTLAQNQIAGERLTNAIGTQNANYQYGTRAANEDYALGNRGIDIQAKALQNQRDALGRQPGFLQTLHDIAQRGFGLSRENVTAASNVNRRALESQLTARGAFTSVGGNQGRQDIATQLQRQIRGVGLSSEDETARYFENMAQVGDQNNSLDRTADRIGLDRDQLKSTLQRGLDRLNIDQFSNVADLQNQLQSNDLNKRVIANDAMNKAMSAGDYNYFAGQTAPVGPTPQTQKNYRGYQGGSVR